MKKYSTKIGCDGDVYVSIAETLTQMGHPMNHCTARNVVLNVMTRIVKKIAMKEGLFLSRAQIYKIAQNPEFQTSLMKIFDRIEASSKT